METQKKSLAEKNARMQELQMEFNPQEKAAVIVKGEVYPGTTIIIGDSSMQVKILTSTVDLNGSTEMLRLPQYSRKEAQIWRLVRWRLLRSQNTGLFRDEAE